MPELICDTSPIQYLYQLGLLRVLPALAERVLIPPAVVEEVAAGRALGVNLPDLQALDWVTTQRPIPLLDKRQVLRFRLAHHIRVAVLKLAGEESVGDA